ncbi:MAG: peptidase U34 [Planctomycetia bacterium]|nr:peptidase U34 [Planctomycetia bacterium]
MCDTLAIVESGRVLFGKNSDRDPNEAQLLDWQPRRTHAPGALLRCTYIDIPQAAATHAVLLSRPFWMWGAEMGANEHGVVIGNEAVFTRERYAKSGLTGMDLVRLALERADSAARAVETIVALLEEFGQGGGCGLENRRFTYHNSFILADTRAAFVLETAGRLHAVEEITGARSISNGLTIPGFARAHSDTIKTHVSACRARRERTQALAGRAESVADVMAILADHGAGHDEPAYSWLNGAMSSPCMHAGGVTAASQTVASWACELSPRGQSHWVTATAAPCVGLFKPVRVDTPLALGPSPTDISDEHSLWWRHEQLHRRVMRDPVALRRLFVPERNATMSAWMLAPPGPREAFDLGDELLQRWTALVRKHPGRDKRPLYVRRYWAKRDRWAGIDLDAATDAQKTPTLGAHEPTPAGG